MLIRDDFAAFKDICTQHGEEASRKSPSPVYPALRSLGVNQGDNRCSDYKGWKSSGAKNDFRVMRAEVKSNFLYLIGRKNTRPIHSLIHVGLGSSQQGQENYFPVCKQSSSSVWRGRPPCWPWCLPLAESIFPFPRLESSSPAWPKEPLGGSLLVIQDESSRKPLTPWELLKIQST